MDMSLYYQRVYPGRTPQIFAYPFKEQLMDSNASGLCIEMGTYTSTIPEEMIELANKHHFPIIIFEIEVPFVEITQDIHSHLINQQ